MKILAISDVRDWGEYSGLIPKYNPDLITLAGDLTSDGAASFWMRAVEQQPEFQREKRELMRAFKVTETGNRFDSQGRYIGHTHQFCLELWRLQEKYTKSDSFTRMRIETHVEKFYEFLKEAGTHSKVLVVKGDHDEDFEGDYNPNRIGRLKNCFEISGRAIDVDGFSFLGLGYQETHYIRILRRFISEFESEANVVLTHCELRRVPLLASVRPKLIIRGHSVGASSVDGIPVVRTAGVTYAVIQLSERRGPFVSALGREWPSLST